MNKQRMKFSVMRQSHFSKEKIKKPLIMGILNVTPDSFSDGGVWSDSETALAHVKEMISDGATIIDVGGESTRPGYTPVSIEEEIKRVIPIIEKIKPLCNSKQIPISIDTSKSEVAEAAAKAGATFLNDINGLQKDSEIANIAAKYDMEVCIMHNRDTIDETVDIVEDIIQFFDRSIQIANQTGIDPNKIILDPGIGFGKTLNQNYIVLNQLSRLHSFQKPILLGCSRKSLIGKLDLSPADERVGGTVATTLWGLANGVQIFRVHDVHPNRQAVDLYQSIINQKATPSTSRWLETEQV